jgi:hydroxymethylpyrimidine/phosphomethylpyrimidine kinase
MSAGSKAGGSPSCREAAPTNLALAMSDVPNPTDRPSIPRVLSIAGSDSGGGAGIQADLKAFAACKVHGMTAITAITAQNTTGVSAVHQIPAEVIIEQVRAVAGDIGVDAVKIGMLGDADTIEAVASALAALPAETPVVLDPVMVAESGAELLQPSARAALIALLIPRATVLTPNLPEARALAAHASSHPDRTHPDRTNPECDHPDRTNPERDHLDRTNPDPETLARAVHALGPAAVVVTGGHRERTVDLFFDGERLVEIPGERHPDGAAHGSGCTHSSVLAARLAWGDDPLQAARVAQRLASRAVANGLAELGAGAGPVDILGLKSG